MGALLRTDIVTCRATKGRFENAPPLLLPPYARLSLVADAGESALMYHDGAFEGADVDEASRL